MNNTKRIIKYFFLFIFFIIVGLVFFITRTPYVSNKLKSMIIPEFEAVSGKRITLQKIYINIMPLFVEAKGLNVFDNDGTQILSASKVKGYIDVIKLLERNVSIQRLILKDPKISSSRSQIEEIIENVTTYSKKGRGTEFKVNVEVEIIECTNGTVLFSDKGTNSSINIKGLYSEATIEEEPRIKMSIKHFDVKKSGWPDIRGDLKALFKLKGDEIEVKSLEIGSYGSRFKGKGFYSKGKSIFKTDMALLVDSVKRFFHLRQKGDGRIAAQGEIKLGRVKSLNDISVNLKLKGDFYLETLMELLKVKERLDGLVDFKGVIKGPLPHISGSAKARLRKGNLFNVDIDDLTCDVSYHDGTLKFENGIASLYNGSAQASSVLNLPGPESLTLNVAFHAIDSDGAFRFIGWNPGVPKGKVDGELFTSGNVFRPDGWFSYMANQQNDENVLGRVRNIQGKYSLKNKALSFTSLLLKTSESNLSATGSVNIAQNTLNMNMQIATKDIADLVLPYYRGVTGRADFSGFVTGTLQNPKISGEVSTSTLSLENYTVDSAVVLFSYEKNLLDIQKAVFSSPNEQHSISGDISFPEANELFDLAMPRFNLSASIRNADFGRALKVVFKDIPARGSIRADMKISGKNKDIDVSGNASIENAAVYNISFDSASLLFSYRGKDFLLKRGTVKKGSSVLTGEALLTHDKKFSYEASSEKILIKDLGLEYMPDDVVVKLQSHGNGSFENPSINLTAKVIGGSFKGRTIGSGTVEFIVKDRDISLNAALFDEKMTIIGKGYFDDKLPWNAQITFHPGRYDFIVSAILKDVPEDLQLDLSGQVDMKGDRRNITVYATIKHLLLSLFEQTFSNESDIHFSMHNKKISFTALTIKSGSTSFRLKGGLEIGKEYDIFLDGSSALAPLKGLSRKIGYLQGHGDFVITVKGKWDNPDLKGGMNVENASFALRDHPSYIRSINGYLTIDENRITLKNLTGKIGGGNITISGIVYLKKFRFKSFYGDIKLDNITTFISRKFHVNFGGNLLYRGTLEAQTITGDIRIKRAKYEESINLKSLIIATKTKEIPKAELSALEKTTLNIQITGSKNISIDNNIARAPIKVDLLLRGTLSSPVLFGRIESKEGYAYFRNNEFRIISASADFADPSRTNPFINLSAETIVEGYKINLYLEGLMENLELSLSSDPHLDEEDILALLTVGYIGDRTQTAQDTLGTGIIAGVAQEVLEERMRNIIGLDRFYIDTYVSKTKSTVIPRVTVSKRIVGDKFIVTYAAPLGHTEEQMLKLEYFVDRRTSLMGVWDEYGGIGGDIKFRFEFK